MFPPPRRFNSGESVDKLLSYNRLLSESVWVCVWGQSLHGTLKIPLNGIRSQNECLSYACMLDVNITTHMTVGYFRTKSDQFKITCDDGYNSAFHNMCSYTQAQKHMHVYFIQGHSASYMSQLQNVPSLNPTCSFTESCKI